MSPNRCTSTGLLIGVPEISLRLQAFIMPGVKVFSIYSQTVIKPVLNTVNKKEKI